jgi:ADP-heptose:LPS heptosyltransferase
MIRMDRPVKRAAAILADAVLGALAPLLVTRRPARTGRPRVLVVRCDHLGDAVLATPVLRPLRDALQPERFDVLASPWNASIFEDHPAVDEVLRIETPWWLAARDASLSSRLRAWRALPADISRIRARRYDIIVDLRGDLRQILLFLALGGAPERVSSDRTGGRRLLTSCTRYVDAQHEVEKNARVVELLGARGPWRLDVAAPLTPALVDATKPFIALGLSSNKLNHRWPRERAAALARRLNDELHVQLVYVGGEADREDGDAIARLAGRRIMNAAGRATPRQSIALLRDAAALITLDAGQLHLGAAAGCPTVALFGQSDPMHFAPWGVVHRIVAEGAPCGCSNPDCQLVEGPGACMRRITPDAVFDAVAAISRR